MSSQLERLGLKFNPFEPSASGTPVGEKLWLPRDWVTNIQSLLNMIERGRGVKAIAISGEYGSGKTYILKWLQQKELPVHRIKAFYFDNPGVQFYDLANSLLRSLGRKDFAKTLWELVSYHVSGYQRSLFTKGFDSYLQLSHSKSARNDIMLKLQTAILKTKITKDEEIALRLALMVVDTPIKPYFEYRDFVAGRKDALVAEKEEAGYFKAILNTLKLGYDIESIAFLIDEFEEISLQKRLSRREAHGYLATLKRLINLTVDENLWVIVAMTPDAVDKTRELEPALWERFTAEGKFKLEVKQLNVREAKELIRNRLREARINDKEGIFPFPDDLEKAFSPATISSPRKIIKVCFYSISQALSGAKKIDLPFKHKYLKAIEDKVYFLPAEDKKS